MRSISFGLAVGFLLVACGGDEVKPPVTPAAPVATMTPPPAVEPVKELYTILDHTRSVLMAVEDVSRTHATAQLCCKLLALFAICLFASLLFSD